jgi:hypothetical protein
MWLEVIKFVLDIFKNDKQANQEEKERLAEFLNEISILLEQTAFSIQSGVYPHGSCTALSSCANSIMDILRNKIDHDRSISLVMLLDEACVVEREWAFRDNPDTVSKLLKASGEFKAAAMLIKI